MIYQMFVARQPGDEEPDEYRRGVYEKMDEVIKSTGTNLFLYCNTRWSNEEFPAWGVSTYPSMQARIELTNRFTQAGWYTFSNIFSLLGIGDSEPQQVMFPNPIYTLWVIENNPAAIAAYKQLSKGEQDELMASAPRAMDQFGGCMVFTADCYWADNRYRYFGVEAFPSFEALQGYNAELLKLDWPLYVPGISWLGLPVTSEG